MNKKVKKQWIEALLSGEYVQTKGKLCKRDIDDGDSFCCLGVLCDLHARSHEGQYWEISVCPGVLNYDEMSGMPPEKVQAWSGVEEMGKLSTMNDAGASYKKIARYIKDNL